MSPGAIRRYCLLVSEDVSRSNWSLGNHARSDVIATCGAVHNSDVVPPEHIGLELDPPLVAITSDLAYSPADQPGTTRPPRTRASTCDCSGDIGFTTRLRDVAGRLRRIGRWKNLAQPGVTRSCIPRDGNDPVFRGYLFSILPLIHRIRHSQGLEKTADLKSRTSRESKSRCPRWENNEKIAGIFRAVDRELALLERRSRCAPRPEARA